jgi:hypothetical protein
MDLLVNVLLLQPIECRGIFRWIVFSKFKVGVFGPHLYVFYSFASVV